jgi:hypothetical protein
MRVAGDYLGRLRIKVPFAIASLHVPISGDAKSLVAAGERPET